MKILLFSIIILFSTPVIFAYGQLEYDVDFMVYKGGQYLKMFNYEEAITFFDKALELEPNNVEALYQKANAFSALEKYNEAIQHYEKVLNIDQENQNAIIRLHNALVSIANYKYGFLDGVLEIKVHDSNGNLVAFQRATKIFALESEITENIIENWPVSKTVTRNNQNYAVHQQEYVKVVDNDTIFGFHEIPYSDKVDLPIASTWHYQIPVEKGDVVTYVYSIFLPAR